MNRLPYYLILVAVVFVSHSILYSQDISNAFGVGTSIGVAIPRTDIGSSIETPVGRLFFRYYPDERIALEGSVGMGYLEAQKGNLYFNSYIYPVDVRIVFEPLKQSKISPYVYCGAGLLFFNPKDLLDNPLKYNARGDYKKVTSYFPIGAGLNYPISKNTEFGISGGYNLTSTNYLEDIKTSSKDAYWNVTLNFFAFLRGENPDLDGDGLLNVEEKEIGTDPLNPDTDGDLLRDGEEVHQYKTDPLNKDTDGDELTDGEEVLTYRTNPLNKDTDGDGLTDGREVKQYKTDPLNPDTDGDRLNDGDEVMNYRTDPLKVDTDGDGLNDGDEVLTYKTDPLNVDTDKDELTDGNEVLTHKTNPLVADTDNGGVPDGKEVQLSLNPLNPGDDVPIINVGERIILEGVNFETNKTALLTYAQQILDQVALSLVMNPTAEVAIHGHTDNVGGARYNMQLSLGRAEAVKAYIISKGISGSRVTTKGFGFTKPIADNSTAEGRAKNRRIEFVRLK
jgi:outer membrane protein OmpA-like peptidoglycan-associated protein